MAVQRGVHPSAEVLKAFGLGKLNDSSSEVVMSHLDQCEDCRKEVASLSGDDFLHRLRKAQGLSSTAMPAKVSGHAARAPQPPTSQTPPANLPPELAANQQYEILRELGRGGMGVVYLAKNKLMDRLEVLKVVNKTHLDHPGAVERFLREIRAAAKLNHANVVAAYSALQMGELLAFAMEYVEGQDLASVVKSQGPLPVPHACFYVQQAAHGLQHAYEKGMVHRDIKPQNLILAREGKKHIVKVLDFGLAKATREKKDDTGLTGEGKMLGTPDYIAPEQTLDAAHADIRADIYSLGCTLYYLLSGHPPFSATSLSAMLLAHQSQEAKPLNLVRPEVPEELAAVVRRMMAKSPAKRYQTPLEVVQALAPFVKQGTTPKPSPDLSASAAEPKPVVKKAARIDPPLARAAEAPKKPPAAVNVWESLMEDSSASVRPGKSEVLRKPQAVTVSERIAQKKWLLGGGIGVGVLLLALLGMWAGGMFDRKVIVTTKDGILVIEVSEPNPEVLVDGEKVTVTWHNGGKKAEIRVKPGTHKVEVKKDGFSVEGKELTFKDGAREIFTASLQRVKPPEPPKPGGNGGAGIPAIEEKWIREVSALPAEQQLERVREKLKELNPDFDGELNPTIEDNGVVTGLKFVTDDVADIRPLRALKGLKYLSCMGSSRDKGQLADLSPLKDLHLKRLNCDWNNGLSDLSPLKGMPLTLLGFSGTQVSDLSPLRGMLLTLLACEYTQVSDLSPLKDMPLATLWCGNFTRISDLSPLKGMHLERISLWGLAVSDLSPLKDMPLSFLGCAGSQVSDLSPLKGMPLVELYFDSTRVTDLSPLKDMPLKRLNRISFGELAVSDLSPLKGMPLTFVGCSGTQVSDLSPLKGMPIESFYFTPKNITKGIEIIRQMKSLKNIGINALNASQCFPPDEFWKRYDAGEFQASNQKREDSAPPASGKQRVNLPENASVDDLRQALKDKDPAVQEEAAKRLAILGPEAEPALKDLAKMLTDAKNLDKVRVAAASSISVITGKIHDKAKSVTPALAQAIQPSEPLLEVRKYAAEALAQMTYPANEAAIPAILKAIEKDRDPVVRQQCVWALFRVNPAEKFRELGADKVLEKLLDEKGDGTALLRYDAARRLANVLREEAPDKTVGVLLEMLRNKNLKVYNRTDVKVQGGRFELQADLGGDARYMAADALGWLGKKARRRQKVVDALKAAEKDPDPKLSKSATQALKDLGVR